MKSVSVLELSVGEAYLGYGNFTIDIGHPTKRVFIFTMTKFIDAVVPQMGIKMGWNFSEYDPPRAVRSERDIIPLDYRRMEFFHLSPEEYLMHTVAEFV